MNTIEAFKAKKLAEINAFMEDLFETAPKEADLDWAERNIARDCVSYMFNELFGTCEPRWRGDDFNEAREDEKRECA